MSAKTFKGPVVMGTEEIMADKGKGHGTSAVPIQKDLRWNCDIDTADKICNHNRHYAEYGGYWEKTSFLKEESEASGEITFYDSNTGKPLFYGPKDRDWAAFVKESKAHGWPSFRDSEVNWDFVRILPKCAARCRTRAPPRPPRPSACRASARASRCVPRLCHPLSCANANEPRSHEFAAASASASTARISGTICPTARATGTASTWSRWPASRRSRSRWSEVVLGCWGLSMPTCRVVPRAVLCAG